MGWYLLSRFLAQPSYHRGAVGTSIGQIWEKAGHHVRHVVRHEHESALRLLQDFAVGYRCKVADRC